MYAFKISFIVIVRLNIIVIPENGRYISKYQITIPAELADYE